MNIVTDFPTSSWYVHPNSVSTLELASMMTPLSFDSTTASLKASKDSFVVALPNSCPLEVFLCLLQFYKERVTHKWHVMVPEGK
jgi:hypothetical protein